jgi:hypothetical protein
MKPTLSRSNRRPKLFLPLFLCGASGATPGARDAGFPLTPEQLRRTVAEMIG